jgi:malonyl-CoA O-methyltransferase
MLGWLKNRKIPMLTPLEGYERWAETYANETNPIKDYSNQWVEQFLPPLKGLSVLDAGCGTGHFCKLAEMRGASRIVGLDFSEAMINLAKVECPTAEFYCDSISTMAFAPGSFDVIICALVLGHVENIEPVLVALANCLKKNGELIITDFHPILTAKKSKRTFKEPTSGKTMEIEHFLHPIQDTLTSLTKADLHIQKMEEPVWNNVPVIYALSAKKE